MRTITMAGVFLAGTAMGGPVAMTHQGRALDSVGDPINGDLVSIIELYDAPVDGTRVHIETPTLQVRDGYYAHTLGLGGDLTSEEIGTTGLWLQVTLGGEALGRTPVGFVPLAAVADSVVGGVVDVSEVRINGETVIDSSGTLVGPASSECPAGWVDLGPTCAKATFEDNVNYLESVEACYSQGARVCDEQDHLFLCANAADLGITYPDREWFYTGTRSYEHQGSAVYSTRHVVRRSGSGDNGCFDNWSGQSISQNSSYKNSWAWGTSRYKAWCCRTP